MEDETVENPAAEFVCRCWKAVKTIYLLNNQQHFQLPALHVVWLRCKL